MTKQCKNCKLPIDVEASRCPHCQTGQRSWFQRHPIWTVFLILIVFGTIADARHPQSDKSGSADAQVSEKPTPTSTDPCHEYIDTDNYGPCVQMGIAQKKGVALDHPLKAKVTTTDYAITLTNTEASEWDMCTATLDDTDIAADNFQSDGFALKPGQAITIRWSDFVNAESQRFNYAATRPNMVDLDCTVNKQEHRSIFDL